MIASKIKLCQRCLNGKSITDFVENLKSEERKLKRNGQLPSDEEKESYRRKGRSLNSRIIDSTFFQDIDNGCSQVRDETHTSQRC